jgi:pimeloyl-ACP methyl ester carboxylesterase
MVARNFSGAPILYETMGGGEPLLLVHGLMATGEIFDPVIDAFARRHTVVVPDLRGHGRSMHLEGPLTVEQHVLDLIRVSDHLDILGTDVLGYSQGGGLALQIAHDRPERVRRQVLSMGSIIGETRLADIQLPNILRHQDLCTSSSASPAAA